jgi:hypothetical protein
MCFEVFGVAICGGSQESQSLHNHSRVGGDEALNLLVPCCPPTPCSRASPRFPHLWFGEHMLHCAQ